MRYLALGMLVLLAACARHYDPTSIQVSNPYQERAEAMARSGVDALGREQWKSAQMLFGNSLQAATLADNSSLIALAWYNLGQARAGGGDASAARDAYAQSMQQADKAGDAVGRQRAALALALLETGQAQDDSGDTLIQVPDDFPVDIHLAAARLASLRERTELARYAYEQVLVMAGEDRVGLIYSARAHLGLALLSGKGDIPAAQAHLQKALELIHRAGEPRLMLQALNLAADMEADPARRQVWRQRAASLGQALREKPSE